MYIDMRRGQRRKLLWINQIWDFWLDLMLGYGKETWRTAVVALGLTFFGAIVFAPGNMQWKNPQETQTNYCRFWYSLDQFAPVIDLGDARNWGPSEDSWTRYYVRIHRIAGWILLPLAVGAVTGLVK